MRFILICLLSLVIVAEAQGQGFNTFNQRNHPELRWQVAETPHFRIMYPARIAGIEAEAAAIAEESYRVLSANLGVSFEEKIRIYLSDEDEVVNGFAAPVGNGYTDIWVHQNAGLEIWTGREKWLRKVLAHELAHLFHYRAVITGSYVLNALLGDPLPRFWTEGLAQYETETWDSYRGDRWLRTAVLDDQLSYSDGRSAWNGRLLYASGNSQVRYFAEQYGDTTLSSLLAHRKKTLFGLVKVHDFDAAFKAVVDTSYRDFYDAWRRHINVYYNTLAGQMATTDSLGTNPLKLPGQYLYDVQFNPGISKVAVLSLTSLARPVRRLFVYDRKKKEAEVVAEGNIRAPISWSADGKRLAFARLSRGNHASLLHDLYVVDADGGNLTRLTHSRRASSPAFSPDGEVLAFVGAEGGTANVFLLDLKTGTETPLTRYAGDVQISSLAWQPGGSHLAYAVFEADGVRRIMRLDVETGTAEALTDGIHDDRMPVWSADGQHLAYTSLRDDVPNTFVYDPATGRHRRVTRQVTGATVHDWLPPDSAYPAGSLIVTSGLSKSRDRAYRISAARTAADPRIDIPPAYTGWTTHRPPKEVPPVVSPDASLVLDRYAYNSWRNITPVLNFVAPYYDGETPGIFGLTAWVEPLAKHSLAGVVGLAAIDPLENSFFQLYYANGQLRPTLGLNLYRFPGTVQTYGTDLLVENVTGGDLAMDLPLDLSDRPYVAEHLSASVSYLDARPLDLEDFELTDDLPAPEEAQQVDLSLAFTLLKQRPYRYDIIHPLDGLGLRVKLTGAAALLGTDSEFVRGDISAFGVFPGPGLQRLYLYGRAQAQTGRPRAQDFIGLSRYDHFQIPLPGFIPFSFSSLDRVRGYRSYAVGNRVLFGTAEYRVPLLSDLQTRILGVVQLGAVTAALFADAGMVWTGADYDRAVRRTGAGVELKNVLNLGIIEIGHSAGVAQPAVDIGTENNVEIYYRIRAAVPF